LFGTINEEEIEELHYQQQTIGPTAYNNNNNNGIGEQHDDDL
jgi:hypothetical protein